MLVISTPSLPEDVRVCACVPVSQGRGGRRTRLGEAGCKEPSDVGSTRALRESELCDNLDRLDVRLLEHAVEVLVQPVEHDRHQLLRIR